MRLSSRKTISTLSEEPINNPDHPSVCSNEKDGCNPCGSLHCRCTILWTQQNITTHALIGNNSLRPPAKHAEVLPSTFLSNIIITHGRVLFDLCLNNLLNVLLSM